jgi:hypothetical protein
MGPAVPAAMARVPSPCWISLGAGPRERPNPKRSILGCARNFKSCMPKHAVRSIDAKPCEVVGAGHTLNMPIAAFRAVATEASRVIRTLVLLLFLVDVPIWAFLIRAFSILGKEEAFRHARRIDGVEIVAQVLLLAESAKVVLADGESVVAGVAPLAAVAAGAAGRREEVGAEIGARASRGVIQPPHLVEPVLDLESEQLTMQRCWVPHSCYRRSRNDGHLRRLRRVNPHSRRRRRHVGHAETVELKDSAQSSFGDADRAGF